MKYFTNPQVIPPDWQKRIGRYFEKMADLDSFGIYTADGGKEYFDPTYMDACGQAVAEVECLFDTVAAFDDFMKRDLVMRAAKKGYADGISDRWEEWQDDPDRTHVAFLIYRKYHFHYLHLTGIIESLPPCPPKALERPMDLAF